MKKILYITLIVLSSSLLFPLCKGNISVNPSELSILMQEEFIQGNTSEKIIVKNHNDFSYNVTCYIEHPNPIYWLRPNRTCIPNISWIDVDPKWIKIQPNDIGEFYIHLNVPEEKENLNQQWETWITFKEGLSTDSEGFINQEYAIRVYIDTIKQETIDSTNLNIFQHGVVILKLIFLTVLAIALIILVIGLYKKKKERL